MIRLSKHITDVMDERGIGFTLIETVLASPGWQTPDVNPGLTRSFKSIPEFGGRVLRVVHRPDGTDIFVVTATWDRGAKRK